MTTTTRPARDYENRLTARDRDRITVRVGEVLREWRAGHPREWRPTLNDRDSLERIAWHAIGCSEHDLRTVELAEIRQHVAAQAGWR